ncbi:MAG: murein DD-endopeptidase MepM/ murein hydrolase activator NlpD, partial [Alphaproteobacteria bacterium]
GHVRYLGVGRFGQVGILFLTALIVGWVGFTSVRFVSSTLVVAERNVRIATTDRVIRNMQGEIDDLSSKLEEGAQSIDKQAKTNEEIASQNTALSNQISSLEAERERLVHLRDARDRDVARLSEELDQTKDGQQNVSRQLSEAEKRDNANLAEREKLAEQIESANSEIARLNDKIIELNSDQSGLADELKSAQSALKATADESAGIISERAKLNHRIATLSEQLELFAASQSESIGRLGESADQGIDALERTLVVAGLDIPLMLKRVLGADSELLAGVGGPLLALDDELDSEAGEKLIAVERRLVRLQGLQGLMKHLPFAAPLNEIRLSSGFGRRHDPFNNKLAMHPGLDFASRSKNAIHVTAPGTVAFVGWNGGYGKTVEVDHGLGIRTRYAHMSRIFVKRGQKLEFREKVGLVGSTGRSTSAHLHYEIMVDGQQLDPANFLRAGQYVFKN